eukprot:878948-Pyramimonas_sp.AAC.1
MRQTQQPSAQRWRLRPPSQLQAGSPPPLGLSRVGASSWSGAAAAAPPTRVVASVAPPPWLRTPAGQRS